MSTKISWADETVNVIGGCTNADDDECRLCYSRGMSHRLGAQGLTLYRDTTVNLGDGVEWTGRINTDLGPLVAMRGKRPRRIFLNSMSDWCHPGVSTEFIGEMWAEMARQTQHTFLLLTKRPGRIAKVLGPNGCGFYAVEGHVPNPQPNVWLGTSIGKNDSVWRADRLREAPAVYRFLSCEPLLGPLNKLDLMDIDYVIVGGESGRRAMPMHPDWALDLRDRCVSIGVKFEFKQWGEFGPYPKNWPAPGSGSDRSRAHVVTIDGRHWTERAYFDGKADPDASSCRPTAVHKVGAKYSGDEFDGERWHESPDPWLYVAGRGWLSPEQQAEVAR